MRKYFKSEFHGTQLTADRLRQVLSYATDTGDFIWLEGGRGRYKRAGALAGRLSKHGYRIICVDGTTCMAHRLAWLYVHGEWPAHEIDHINGVRTDNRITNLRDVSRAINAQNIRAARSDSKSGLLGVSAGNGGFVAAVQLNGRQHYLGTFQTPEEAQAVYLGAKRRLHEGCTI